MVPRLTPVSRSVARMLTPSQSVAIASTCFSRGRIFMGAIHDAELPLKRVEGGSRYRYIGIHDHRFRGQSLGCWSRSWPLLAAAAGSTWSRR